MIKNRVAILMLTAAFACAAPVFADSDPTMQQIYDQAKSGHLAEAQQMITQVLQDYPRSGKAHYVAAELYAKQGNLSLARVELNQAEQFDPGLPFAKPESVQALKAELAVGGGTARALTIVPAAVHHSFPWGPVLILVGVLALIWMFVRRRNTYAQFPSQYPGGAAVAGGVPGPYGAPGGVMGGGVVGGGMGSGIVGGLASGLAVGAGVVAGEELAHHFLDGGERRDGFAAAPQEYTPETPSNDNMGGADFGVNDPGSSWDDAGGGGGGGGGDDWT
jgi:hypothetical protein